MTYNMTDTAAQEVTIKVEVEWDAESNAQDMQLVNIKQEPPETPTMEPEEPHSDTFNVTVKQEPIDEQVQSDPLDMASVHIKQEPPDFVEIELSPVPNTVLVPVQQEPIEVQVKIEQEECESSIDAFPSKPNTAFNSQRPMYAVLIKKGVNPTKNLSPPKAREDKREEQIKELKRQRNRERQRAYYHRQKNLKKNEKKKKAPKTNAERQREFRQRKSGKYKI